MIKTIKQIKVRKLMNKQMNKGMKLSIRLTWSLVEFSISLLQLLWLQITREESHQDSRKWTKRRREAKMALNLLKINNKTQPWKLSANFWNSDQKCQKWLIWLQVWKREACHNRCKNILWDAKLKKKISTSIITWCKRKERV